MLRTHVLRGFALACVLGFVMGASDVSAGPGSAACDPDDCPLPCMETCTPEQAAACPLPCAATSTTVSAAACPQPGAVAATTGSEAACPLPCRTLTTTDAAACPLPCASRRSLRGVAGDVTPRVMVGLFEIL